MMTILAALLLVPMTLLGQTYQQLWKQVEAAQDKDLPQTAIESLEKIEAKAQRERAYGQLLKSTLLHSRLKSEVAPDSLCPAVARLEKQLGQVSDEALQAVYATVLAKVYEDNPQLCDDSDARSKGYRQRAMSHPEVLAKVEADVYEPFLVRGKDSQAFGHDLLSVVGMELDEWQWLEDYYRKAGNRRALCHLALRTAYDLSSLDSLAALYGDLPEADMIAKRRQNEWTTMTNPQFRVEMPRQVAMPDEAQTLRLHHLRNISSLTIRVFRTTLKGDTNLNPNDSKDLARIKSGMKEVTSRSRTLTFSKHPEQEEFEDSVVLEGLSAGVYLIECSSPGIETSRALHFVSGVRVMMQAMPGDMLRYVVVDAHSGQPLGNAVLQRAYRMGWKKPNKVEEHACNLQGEVTLKQERSRYMAVYAYTPTDAYCPSVNANGRYNYYERDYNTEHTNLFTDRSICPCGSCRLAGEVCRRHGGSHQQAHHDGAARCQLQAGL